MASSQSDEIHMHSDADDNTDSECDVQTNLKRKEPSGTEESPNKQQRLDESKNLDINKIQRQYRKLFYMKDAFARHKEIMNYYLSYADSIPKLEKTKGFDETDDVVIIEQKFLSEDAENANNWKKELAKKYYEKLVKEYCCVDLCDYKEGKISLRWRKKNEIILGTGQFICASVVCTSGIGLTSWEVNFAHSENGIKKDISAKVRLCPNCSYKLNYRNKKKRVEKKTYIDVITLDDDEVPDTSDKPSTLSAAASDAVSQSSSSTNENITKVLATGENDTTTPAGKNDTTTPAGENDTTTPVTEKVENVCEFDELLDIMLL